METYIHPQETWTESDCRKRAAYAPADAWGNRPPKGIIAPTGSTACHYGQTVRYNGGCIREGEYYAAESKPLPVIPPNFEFVAIPSWGLAIRAKN